MNIFFPPHQEKVFVIMLIFGVISGVLFDLFRVKRHLLGENSVILFADDLIFSLLTLLLFLFTVFVANNGIFRWYEVLFSLIGFWLYRLTLSKTLIFVSFKVIDFVKKLLGIAAFPVKLIFSILFVLISPVKQLIIRCIIKQKIIKFSKNFL
jgi:hypothetical protein